MTGIELVIVAMMIAFNSVFAAYEIALASITLSRLEMLSNQGLSGARPAAFMKKNMEGSLAGIQVGITLVGVIAAATSGAGAEEQLAPILQEWLGLTAGVAEVFALAIVVAPLTLVTILFGELVPKMFALRNNERVCLRLSPAMKWFCTVVWPLVWLLETAVKRIMSWSERRLQPSGSNPTRSESLELQELRAAVALARTSRLIGAQEEKIILGASLLSSQTIGQIILSADAISMLEADADISECLIKAHLDMHTRYPVTERKGDPQAIIGYVNFKDLFSHMRLMPTGQSSIRKIMRAIPSFQNDDIVSHCLEKLIRDHVHIALVRQADGQIMGMITLEDIVEELLGDIQDEYDRLPMHLVVFGQGWLVGGGVHLQRLREITGLDLIDSVANREGMTLSDWLSQGGEHPISPGEIRRIGDFHLSVRKIRRKRLMEALIVRVN